MLKITQLHMHTVFFLMIRADRLLDLGQLLDRVPLVRRVAHDAITELAASVRVEAHQPASFWERMYSDP